LYGLVTSPLLHSGFSHLVANSLPFLLLGIVIAVEGSRRRWQVAGITALSSGLGAWLTPLAGPHITRASGAVFGVFGQLAGGAGGIFAAWLLHRRRPSAERQK